MPKKGTKLDKKPVGDPNDPDGIGVWVKRYLVALGTKNYADQTIENRERDLRHFMGWAADRSVTRPGQVTRAILEGYQRHLFYSRKKNGKPLAFRTQHSRLIPVRSLFRWLTKQNVIPSNPASELELPRLERRLPKHVLNEPEIEKVMAVPDLEDPLGLRDRSILEVLYSTAIRRMEVINLKLTDLDVERGTLLVKLGKGRKDRMVPIGERAVHWVNAYLDQVRPTLVVPPDDGTIFITEAGEPFSPRRMTQLVGRYVDAANVGKHGACHLIRHSTATLMLEGGADIRHLQEMLGHVLTSTTAIYAQVSIRQLKRVHDATHPGAHLDRPAAGVGAIGSGDTPTVDELLHDLDAEGVEEDGDDGP